MVGWAKLSGEVVRLWASEGHGEVLARTVALISGAGGESEGRGEIVVVEVEAERGWS